MPKKSTPAPSGLNQHDFTATYKTYRGKVYNFIAFRIIDKELAADLTQDVFIKVHKNLHRHDPAKGSLVSWIYRIAYNTMVTQTIRSKARKTTPFSRQWEDDDAIEHQTGVRANCLQPEPGEDHNQLQAAIAQLSPKLRQVIELAYFGGLIYEDIAEELSIPMGTVKNRIHLAKQELRVLLTGKAKATPKPVDYREYLAKISYQDGWANGEGAGYAV